MIKNSFVVELTFKKGVSETAAQLIATTRQKSSQ